MYTYVFSYIYVYKRNLMLKDLSGTENAERQTLSPDIRRGKVTENFKIRRGNVQLEFKIYQ